MNILPTALAACVILHLPALASGPTHPRLFPGLENVSALRSRAASPEGREIVSAIRFMRDGGDPFGSKFHKEFGNSAILYLATGDPAEANLARDEMLHYIAQPDLWANPKQKGLRRGALARGGALSYDLCFEAWKNQTVPDRVTWKGKTYEIPEEYVGKDLNSAMSLALLANAESLLESGGADWPGGNKFGNNWYGVRYGGAVLSLLASDEPRARELLPKALSPLQRYIETSLGTHAEPAGWNPEGYGYTLYPSQFTFPAILAVRHLVEAGFVQNVPAVEKNPVTVFHGLMALPQRNSGFLGLHPDFQDDNVDWIGEGTANLAFAFAADTVKPGLKWLYNRTFGAKGDKKYDSSSCGGLYALLYYPMDGLEKNPAGVEGLGRTFSDRRWGMVSLRKDFSEPGSQDILTQFMVKTGRTDGGHNGPDGLGFRIWGLGVPWTTGSGRTSKAGGQCTVFATDPDSAGFQSQIHEWLDSDLRASGGGFVVARAKPFSDVGTGNHIRRYIADYEVGTGCEAVFVVADTTDNGKFWRLNTPGFGHNGAYNKISHSGNTFTITNELTGHRLVGVVLYPVNPVFRTGDFQRGSPMSAPLGDHATEVTHNHWIDVSASGPADGDFLVALCLLRKDAALPRLNFKGTPGDGQLQIGSRQYHLGNRAVQVEGWSRPHVKITAPGDQAALSGAPLPVTIQGEATAPAGATVAEVQIRIDGKLAGTAPVQKDRWTFQTPPLERGRVVLSARALDSSGGSSEDSRPVHLSKSAPPVVSLPPPPAGTKLPAGAPLALSGSAIDPEGKPVTVELFLGERLVTKPKAAADGSWKVDLPPWALRPGVAAFRAVATDTDGDVAEAQPLELVFSARFSDHPEFGDLANWTRTSEEWRVDLWDEGGNPRYRVLPSEGYKKREAKSLIANRTFDGDFLLSFQARLLAPDSLLNLYFGREVYLQLGGGQNPGGLRYTGWGDKPIGKWSGAFFPDREWHRIELERRGNELILRRDGSDYWSMTLHDDRSFTESRPGLVEWDKVFGAREKYRWYANFWSPGPLGIGAPYADASSFLLDDIVVNSKP